MSKSRGFTIVELVVVISIIAILSTIVMTKMEQYTSLSQDTAAKADMRQLSTASVDYASSTDTSQTFCKSDIEQKIAQAVARINPNYTFNCSDPNGPAAPISQGGGSITDNFQTNTNLEGGTTTTCPSGQWYAYTRGLNTTSCWCIDSQGNSEASCGNAATCACQ